MKYIRITSLTIALIATGFMSYGQTTGIPVKSDSTVQQTPVQVQQKIQKEAYSTAFFEISGSAIEAFNQDVETSVEPVPNAAMIRSRKQGIPA